MIFKLIIIATICMAEIPKESFLGRVSICLRSMVSSMYISMEPLSFLIERWVLKEDLPNFHKVSDRVYRGGQPLGEGYKQLEAQGIKTILNLRAIDTDLHHHTEMGYIHIPIHPHHPQEEDVIRFCEVLSDPNNYPIYIHCFHGADRTGLFVAIYRMAFEGWSKEEALKEMVEGGFGFHKAFQHNLIHFLKTLDIDKLYTQET